MMTRQDQMPKREKVPNVGKSMKWSVKQLPDMFASLVVGGNSIFPAIKLTEEPVTAEVDYQDPIEIARLKKAAVLTNKRSKQPTFLVSRSISP